MIDRDPTSADDLLIQYPQRPDPFYGDFAIRLDADARDGANIGQVRAGDGFPGAGEAALPRCA